MTDQQTIADYRSAALDRPGAVPPPPGWPDPGVPWHYGDPHAEQRALAGGAGAVDLSHRAVIRVGGPDRLGWLHSITTQHLESLGAGQSTTALVLSPHGHVEHELHVIEDGEATWLITAATSLEPVLTYLAAMRFLLDVEISDETGRYAVVGEPRREVVPGQVVWLSAEQFAHPEGADADSSRYVPVRPAAWAVREVLVPRGDLAAYLDRAGPLAGTWAWDALRVAAGVPRADVDTDHRTIPHEIGLVTAAVHLHKGCYRGQETVARVHNLGRPPRRLVLLHLDGSDAREVTTGAVVAAGERTVGVVTSVARHHELGPIALALIKRSTPLDAPLTAAGVAAGQEAIVSS